MKVSGLSLNAAKLRSTGFQIGVSVGAGKAAATKKCLHDGAAGSGNAAGFA